MIDLVDGGRPAVTMERRRALVGAVLAGLGGYVVGSLAGWPVLTLLGLVTMVAAWLALQRSIGSVADLPDDQLDERQIGVRDRAYLVAYRLVGAAVAALVIAAIGWDVFDVAEVSTVVAQTAGGGLLFFMVALPACLVGWWEEAA